MMLFALFVVTSDVVIITVGVLLLLIVQIDAQYVVLLTQFGIGQYRLRPLQQSKGVGVAAAAVGMVFQRKLAVILLDQINVDQRLG